MKIKNKRTKTSKIEEIWPKRGPGPQKSKKWPYVWEFPQNAVHFPLQNPLFCCAESLSGACVRGNAKPLIKPVV